MKIFLTFLFVFYSQYVISESDLKRKFPHGLLTEDYGILSEKDLLINAKEGEVVPFDMNKFHPGFRRWQCFNIKDVTFQFNTWKAPDPMGAYDIIVDLCLFSITVKNNNPPHVYGPRRAYRLPFCKNLQLKWKAKTKNETYVCLNGHPSTLEKGEMYWTLTQFKTKKGCGGECDLDFYVKTESAQSGNLAPSFFKELFLNRIKAVTRQGSHISRIR